MIKVGQRGLVWWVWCVVRIPDEPTLQAGQLYQLTALLCPGAVAWPQVNWPVNLYLRCVALQHLVALQPHPRGEPGWWHIARSLKFSPAGTCSK